jgi:hypothetical protein
MSLKEIGKALKGEMGKEGRAKEGNADKCGYVN